ncbi:MAG: dTDP-glucose 4,6-dehydratase [Nitrospirae bacterium RBG_19FT_COMBO_42_15]|nr:MAG: dTDP-glucose 4,6-dehydratase [Nitrospirae bacterium RBG_19FT_COMBO_42_15]
MKLLITGGAGFIGSNFIRYILKHHKNYKVINLDKLTYAGNLENLKDIEKDKRYKFVRGDILKAKGKWLKTRGVDAVINFAAESHVDRSIVDSSDFIQTNVVGTQILLEAAREARIKRYIQISTDEVYGSLGKSGYFTEKTPLAPNSPYSASKAAADMLVRAYFHTHNFPGIITRCSNNYGPYQFPEKFIPLMITNALEGKPLPVYGDGLNVRDWIFVDDHCSAIDAILHKGKNGEVYNIGGNSEKRNIDVVKLILKKLIGHTGHIGPIIKFVPDRKGHDRRYAIDSTKIKKELGWRPKYDFDKGLDMTIDWYLKNKEWWQKIKSGEYKRYYKKMYREG